MDYQRRSNTDQAGPKVYLMELTSVHSVKTLGQTRRCKGVAGPVPLLARFAAGPYTTDSLAATTTDEVVMIFNISAENACQIPLRARRERKEVHRPITIEVEQETEVVSFIQERFEAQNDPK
jgi:hypothetical protein